MFWIYLSYWGYIVNKVFVNSVLEQCLVLYCRSRNIWCIDWHKPVLGYFPFDVTFPLPQPFRNAVTTCFRFIQGKYCLVSWIFIYLVFVFFTFWMLINYHYDGWAGKTIMYSCLPWNQNCLWGIIFQWIFLLTL
jgi:hypothetical protein